MIIVCEAQCKGISHEKVNSGFIFGLRLAYPKEKIIFFSEKLHYIELINIFKSNNISIGNIENIPISFDASKSFSVGGLFKYYFLFKKIFDKLLSFKVNKIFFLSTNPVILFTIKKIKQQKKYKHICCTFVLHGELEDISNIDYKEPYSPVFEKKLMTLSYREMIFKALKNIDKIPGLIISRLTSPIDYLYSRYTLIFKRIFRVKRMMMWLHSSYYKYISLSPHVTKNARKFIDTRYLNFQTIVMPIIYTKPSQVRFNKFIKFAVFGYGDSVQMNKMLFLLSRKMLSRSYEIRIISMDSRGTEGFKNISHVGHGGILTREEMEESVKDIDVFINLYNENRHKFGCSLSIFESLSYLKPVLHLSNPGYDYFNKISLPIGYKTNSLNEFVDKMSDMIENYSEYKGKLKFFRKNMLKCRQKYSIENNLGKLMKSFTF